MRRFFTANPDQPNAEFIQRERSFPPDLRDTSGMSAGAAERAVQNTRIGEPKIDYDVRCVYDSRPANAYDANFSVTLEPGASVATFIVPQGYRCVPRHWSVQFNDPPVCDLTDVQVFIQKDGADLPNNSVFIGSGTSSPIITFFVVEENSTFGLRLTDPNAVISSDAVIQVHGNLLPVTGVALPFEVTNRKI